MKKRVVFIFLLLGFLNARTQVPHAFSYQAVVRDASGSIIANRMVTFRIAVLTGSSIGPEVYSETHSVTTNNFGLVNIHLN